MSRLSFLKSFLKRRIIMAKSKQKARAGDTVELANKDVGFYDPQSQFKVVRDQKKKLGKTVGAKTNYALLSGALLVVGKPAVKDDVDDNDSDIPENFPGREVFVAAEMTFDEVKAMTLEDFDKIKGIGPKTMKLIESWKKD